MLSPRSSTLLKTILCTLFSISLAFTSPHAISKPSWKNNDSDTDGGSTKGPGKGGKNKTSTTSITINSHPESQTIIEGSSVTFSVDATSSDGQSLSYQWFFNDSPIGGATHSAFTITESTSANQGEYKVNILASTTSKHTAATLTVQQAEPTEPPAPTGPDIDISLHPVSQEVYVEDNLTLNISATGSGTLNYQWRKDGINIPDAIHSNFTISSATMGEAGRYDVIVSNETGTLTSNSATVSVKPLSTLSLQWTPPSHRADGSPLNLDEISSYNIYLSYENELLEVITVPGNYTTLTLDGMYAGNYALSMSTIDNTGSMGDKTPEEIVTIN